MWKNLIYRLKLVKFYIKSFFYFEQHQHSVFYALKMALDYKIYFKPKGRLLFLACFPKSGSTYISNIISEITTFKKADLVYDYGRREQEIDYPKLISIYDQKVVVQQHTRAIDSNLDLLTQNGVDKVVVITRNIFDVVVSLRDHLLNESLEKPMAFVLDEFEQLSEYQQYDMIIELMIPWYFNFYVSWDFALKNSKIKIYWLSYEDFMEEKVKHIKEALDFFELPYTNKQIELGLVSVQKRNNRYNQGIKGRGKQLLDKVQIDKIESFARFYPTINFCKMGL